MTDRLRGLMTGLGLLTLAGGAAAAEPPTTPPSGMIEGHPAAYYQYAAKLLGEGQGDAATFWFYAGQLRYRTHIACRELAPSDDDRVLFAALSESVGRPINEYAFGDLPVLVKTLDEVLAWDAETPNAFSPPAECKAANETVRAGLTEMRDKIVATGDEIRAQRERNGLPNRS